MKLFKTTDGFINLEQEGRSFELTVSRIEDKISEMKEVRGLDEHDELVSLDFYEQRGYKLCSIGLGDIDADDVRSELILFLSDLLKIDQASLSGLDYLNLRKF